MAGLTRPSSKTLSSDLDIVISRANYFAILQLSFKPLLLKDNSNEKPLSS